MAKGACLAVQVRYSALSGNYGRLSRQHCRFANGIPRVCTTTAAFSHVMGESSKGDLKGISPSRRTEILGF